MALGAPLFCDIVRLSGFSAPITSMSYSCVYSLYMAASALYMCFLMPFLAVICVNVTYTASLCMSCIIYCFFSPVLVVNWVSYVFPPNFISRRSTPFDALSLLGLGFVFSRSLVYRYPAYISLSSWFVSVSSGCCISSSSIIFLGRSFQWWNILGDFGIYFWWCHYLDHSPCLVGSHLHMSILR